MSDHSTSSNRIHLLGLELSELVAKFEEIGEPAYRATQVMQWIYERGATSLDAMTNLSKSLRGALAERYSLFTSEIIRRAESSDGTIKLLLRWADGETSECVMLPSEHHITACISSQVGCPVGCRFCASGLDGLKRNLTPGEIVEQVLRVSAEAVATGGRLSNLVFMGLGEPLSNYTSVVKAIHTINAPWGPNIGARKITVSTVGLPKQIKKLADEGLQLNLALSLHAPNDELRRELIPWAERITIDELVDACRYYFSQTGREITLEYALLHGTNDKPEHARDLARFVKHLRCNVNLLRYNPVEPLPYARPSSEDAFAFQQSLRKHGVNAHIRKSRGLDIDAACGQLRRKEMQAGQSATVPLNIDRPTE